MKILYHMPSTATVYAGRTIAAGYRHAFLDLGHSFETLTADSRQRQVFETYAPDILMTSLTPYSLKFLDLESVKRQRERGMRVFANMPFWHSPLSKWRVNETPSLSENHAHIALIRSGAFGDVYYNVLEPEDERMQGFEKATGMKHHTILLAADRLLHFPETDERFRADISYIGTYLPEKRPYFREAVFPLRAKYDLRLYGQDWTAWDRFCGMAQKGGQYFNLPLLRSLRKPALALEDERRIYASSAISINVHEEYQRRFGGDCNERTFKVPACGGFEITDDVACIRKYLKEGEEIVIAKDRDDWFQKIDYYMERPEERERIAAAGRERVQKEHTYHNRAAQILALCEKA